MRQTNGGKQMKSVWQIPPPETWEKRFGKHPAQKPVALIERIILASSHVGDLVLDPFLGSGTSAVLAFRTSRRVLGIDSDEDWAMLAVKRICADLVQAILRVTIVQITLELWSRSMDRSDRANSATISVTATGKLVRRECSFYFVGAIRHEVVFAVAAEDMTEAWQKFRASPATSVEILFVIKTQTEIYLAQ